ncbi:MAG: class I SAM-dependent methyltransferase, partial [Desulfocapsa sp.]|nr:class I SAM-dependent methyltransferase [Desulfocapsa sp.]
MQRALLRCPLCGDQRGNDHFYSDRHRDYYRCRRCLLIHVPPAQRLPPEAEKAEYDKHRNSPDDAGYREFLSRLFVPLNSCLRPASQGLDFGSGPGPTLSVMFEEAGHQVSLFDPFYAPNEQHLTTQYDFITASEVVEHLRDPGTDLRHLWSILKPGGWLGFMTKVAIDEAAFSRWHYKNDPTHVCFFSLQTMMVSYLYPVVRVKTLHLLRCCIFYLISTYLSTPKLNKKYAPRIWSFLLS